MIKRFFLIAGIAFTAFTSCISVKSNVTGTPAIKPIHNIETNGKLYAAVFQQNAAEFQALAVQAFNIARIQLDQILEEQAKNPNGKPLAIVTDVDETFIDNSPYAVERALQGKSYSQESWNEWTAKADAKPLLGSQAFFQYAASKGVEVFYITNRNVQDKAATMKNLKKYDYPFVDDTHMIVRTNESSKEARRQKLQETHEIVLLLGDNLSDFHMMFDKKTQEERLQNVKDNQALFGKRFIMFPNSGYGDWEAALFDYNHNLSPAEKDKIYINSVRGF